MSGIGVDLAAIGQAHKAAGHPSPRDFQQVRSACAELAHRAAEAPPPEGAAMLSRVQLHAMVAKLSTDAIGTRNRALLLLGFGSALQQSDLVALDVEHVDERPEGLAVRVASTDEESVVAFGKEPGTCLVHAVRAWRELSGLTTGPLFVGFNRWGALTGERLVGGDFARIVKRVGGAAGLDTKQLSARSLAGKPKLVQPRAAVAKVEPVAPPSTADRLYTFLTDSGYPHFRVKRAIKALGARVETASLDELKREAIVLLAAQPVPGAGS